MRPADVVQALNKATSKKPTSKKPTKLELSRQKIKSLFELYTSNFLKATRSIFQPVKGKTPGHHGRCTPAQSQEGLYPPRKDLLHD